MVVSGYSHAVKVLGFVYFGGYFFCLPNFHGIAEAKEVGVLMNSLLAAKIQSSKPKAW